MRTWLSRVTLLSLASAAALGEGACAQERAPINRVQANALDKTFFLGAKLDDPSDDPEFFWRNYVVDASASQSLVGVGSWGHVDRVRWEITENMLLARKAYQIADGRDDKGATTYTKVPNGTIVAAYKIESHFDVRRQYNTTTGEELNVIEENTTDRPWEQRAFMRVDWSSNLVDDPMWEDVFTGKVFGNLTITPVSYYVADPSAEDAPHIDPKQGYLDVTNKYSVAPAQTASPFSDLSGTVPTCLIVGMYTGSSTYECDAQEATVRASYLKVDPDRDFEPLENTRATLDIVGNPGGIGSSFNVGVVGAGRQGWDPQYGYTDALYHRFASVHNTWKKSHQSATCSSNADADANGTADACENAVTGYAKSSGSQCDAYVGKCTIPYRDREIKTIGYWVNKGAPDELLDSGDPRADATKRGTLEDLIFSWNQLMSVALAYGREIECRRTGDGDRDACHAQFFDSTSDPSTKQMVSYGNWLVDKPKETAPVVTFCHNPVRDYDVHETCGDTGYSARVGDIRHNFVFYWQYESRAPWGGIANWESDPLTGEIIGAAAQIMGRSATYAAAQQRDIIQIANGDAKLEDVVTGVPEQTYVKTLTGGYSKTLPRSAEELTRRVANVNLSHLQATLGAPTKGLTGEARMVADMKSIANSVADIRQSDTSLLEFDALAAQLRNSTAETAMVDSHWLVGAVGGDPSTPLTDDLLNRVSPLRGMDPGRLHAFQDLMTARLEERGACFLEAQAPAAGSVYFAPLAGYFRAKYGALGPKERGDAIYHDLWKESVKGIALHEIGHSLGMLHQFASSWDAPNYNPQYWQLRTNEGKSTAACTGPRAGDDDTCMGPRYLDPETADEAGYGPEPRPAITYFGNTSTMEYQLERAGETVGLGTYDLHTMKALYGRVLETFDDRVMPLANQKAFRLRGNTQLTERDIIDDSQPAYAHYTTAARKMKVFDPVRDCRDATDEERARGAWRVVHGKVCAPQPKDHWAWKDFLSDDAWKPYGWNAPYWHVVDKDGKDRVRWHYRWGTNHNSYFHTNDSDAGADPYEVTMNTARRFDVTYPWAYFRRQNREYYYPGVPSATSDRYFQRVRSYHWLVATDLSRAQAKQQLDSDEDLRPYVMAQNEMFNLLARAILMPEPGAYFAPTVSSEVSQKQPIDSLKLIYDTPTAPPPNGKPDFTLGIVDGRYIGEEFDNDLGGSWTYLNFIKHAGFSVEKALAVEALVDGRPSLFTISRENFLDGRNVRINFRNDLPDAVDRLLGGLLAQDWETVALWVPKTGDTPSPEPQVLDLTLTDGPPARPADARTVFPNVGYKQQLGSAVFAALFSRLNTDMALVNKMRVWIDGQVGGVQVPPDQQVRFTDPASGYTYIARKYGPQVLDGKTVDKGVASRMLAHANALVAATYQVQVDAKGSAVLDAFGAPTVDRDADGQPIVKDFARLAELTKYVGFVDSLRDVGHRLGYGPLSGGESD